jgi:hypothetical protein
MPAVGVSTAAANSIAFGGRSWIVAATAMAAAIAALDADQAAVRRHGFCVKLRLDD